MKLRPYLPIVLACLLALCLSGLVYLPAWADETDPDPSGGAGAEEGGPTFNPQDRLGAPPMPAQPQQADYGAQVYYQVCMACHGDKGQGLTEEWRAIWEEDYNCWRSKCHSTNHPPQGFEFPTQVTGVIGPEFLTRFDTAQELHSYVQETMPWWNPGGLQVEEYWQVTAYLMRAQYALPRGATLDEGNAAVFRIRPTRPIPGNGRPETILMASALALTGGLLLVQNKLRR